MRCEASTRRGVPCARPALVDQTVCASHAGRTGARPRNRNALRHGLYAQALAPEERLTLVLARAAEGMGEEIATTRLMILRALRERDASPAEYARLVDVLGKQLRVERHLRGPGQGLAEALARVLDEMGGELGLGAAASREDA
jgi:hypothetical protein